MEEKAENSPEHLKLFEENQGLVYCVLHKIPRHMRRGHFKDLEQEGKIALWKSVLTFDPKLGLFSSYACTAIKRWMMKYIHQKTLVIRPPDDRKWARWKDLRTKIRRSGMEGVPSKRPQKAREVPLEEMHGIALSALRGLLGRDAVAARCWLLYGDTLETTGKRLGVTKERTRQLKDRGIKKALKEIFKNLS